MKAEDIGSFDVTPSWERVVPCEPLLEVLGFCQCPLCLAAAAGDC